LLILSAFCDRVHKHAADSTSIDGAYALIFERRDRKTGPGDLARA
jgi:hypothetical protein